MLLKIPLSIPLNKVEANVSGLMRPLIIHILKVKLYPKHQAKNHWESEIYTILTDIQFDVNRVKTPSGKVKSSTLLKWLLEFSETMLKNRIITIKKECGQSQIDISFNEIQKGLSKICPLLLNSQTEIDKIYEILMEI
jgi:hypothetical protein